ncbi:hypothetical protein VKT23_004732 [Stygiomarasmius scandens]|uniref:Heterokaryon incompatibility domain-containing protein n=1 Tax=Marasmiellus scandens TaxID=2682957 RepID=A0ABR1JVU2_9AGAR
MYAYTPYGQPNTPVHAYSYPVQAGTYPVQALPYSAQASTYPAQYSQPSFFPNTYGQPNTPVPFYSALVGERPQTLGSSFSVLPSQPLYSNPVPPSPQTGYYTTQRQQTRPRVCLVHPNSYKFSHRLVLQGEEGVTGISNPTSPDLMASVDICPHRFIDAKTLQLVKFDVYSTVPPYAILSHRWIPGKEVVYNEFVRPQKETFQKSGCRKIMAACRKALQDGVRYIWVDTCCIEQGNHEDVAANITSMYAYYQNAEICYAYLADVTRTAEWIEASEWFDRGWTLQELLAPRTVAFFNENWTYIGSKHELRDDICRKTTIPPSVLLGKQSVQDVDVLTRMSWATRRETTKQQDRAYCLQGLLGVSVEPDYDEYWKVSFSRLGRALLDSRPELKETLGISDDILSSNNSDVFYDRLWDRFLDTRKRIELQRERRSSLMS